MSYRPRLLFVPPRYGGSITGGAERLIRWMAEASLGAGCDVHVATTCAVDHETWANALPEGTTSEQGIDVHRFEVTPRNIARHQQLLGELMANGALTELEATDLMATSVWSRGLQDFIDREGGDFDAIVLAPYLFGTTFWGAQSWPEKTILVPCLHDEPFAYLGVVQRMLRHCAALSFNSPGEMALANHLLGSVRGNVVGMGLPVPVARPSDRPPGGLTKGSYFLYAGRVEQGKRVDVAARYVAALARKRGEHIPLAIIGSGSWRPPPDLEPYVHMLGFVSESEKRAAMAGAIALVNPSELESLSIVLMEAWLEGRPALVAARSEVMRDHCQRSGGGVTFADQGEFLHKAAALIDDPARATLLGAHGRDYVLEEYAPDTVLARFLDLVDRTCNRQ